MALRWILAGVLAFALAGCAGARLPAPIGHPKAEIAGFENVRIRASDPELLNVLQRNLARTRAASDKPISVLALSGGGAEGAFGAGVLVGWSKSGTRPQFQVVTGVSTGALIAPFAFLGPDWDGKLEEAFTGRQASSLLVPRGLGVVLGSSIYKGRPLEHLLDSYVDDELLQAVARESEKGRKLLVATTDIDRQETVIWNMGAIAEHGGPEARRLFRKVLAASASIPAIFPPKLFTVHDGAQTFQEMHVDGGVSTPFFTVPPRALFWTEPSGLFQRARLYVIVNGQIERAPQSTTDNTVAVLGSAFDTVEYTVLRNTFAETQGFCQRNGIALQAASVPVAAGPFNPLDFSMKTRKKLFHLGERLGESGQAWNLAKPAG